MSYRPYPTNIPRRYAAEKLSLITPRAHDAVIGPATASLAGGIFPGVAAEVMHGFTAFTSSPTEDTWPAAAFHEIGLYQVEAGEDPNRAPALSPHASHNNWGLLHDHPKVVATLGHSATMENGAWKTALPDQIAVGLVNLRFEHAKRLEDALGHPFSTDPSSNWFVMCVFTAFSRGQTGAKNLIAPHWHALQNLPENDRWPELRRLVAHDISTGSNGSTNSVKKRPSYAIIRTEQKYESGRLLAESLHGNTGWFVCGYGNSAADNALEDTLSRNAG